MYFAWWDRGKLHGKDNLELGFEGRMAGRETGCPGTFGDL